jgi:hypothetical protein
MIFKASGHFIFLLFYLELFKKKIKITLDHYHNVKLDDAVVQVDFIYINLRF